MDITLPQDPSTSRLRLADALLQVEKSGLCLLDAEGRVQDDNEAFARKWRDLAGSSPTVGRRLPRPPPPDIICDWLQELEQAAHTPDSQLPTLGGSDLVGLTAHRLEDGHILLVLSRSGPEQDIRRLEQALRARDTLLNLISHDLRSPVAQMNATLYLLRESRMADHENLDRHLRELQAQTHHLAEELENLLRWGRAQRQGLKPRYEMVDVEVVLSRVRETVRVPAENKRQRLTLHSELGDPVRTDPEMLTAILRNLVTNAVKFTPNGGYIRAVASRDGTGDTWHLRVSDSGVGISAEAVGRIRARGCYFHTGGTAGEKGLGLGLELVQILVELLNGTLDIVSEPGQGTTVEVALPLGQG